MNATSATDKKLMWLRRMIWWLPAFVFAVVAAVYVGLDPLSGGNVFSSVVNALIPAVIVGVLCLAVYFGYKYMLTRNPNL